MATLITNTFETYDAKGIREDLSDIIYNISPTECPFMQNAGRGKVENTFFEWQIESLASAVSTNQRIEGNDVTQFEAVTATTRLGNYTQISDKTLIISDTEEVVNKAGRKSEIAKQLSKKSKELKRDMEFGLLSPLAAVTGNSSTARITAGLSSFIKTNYSKASDDTAPSYTTVANSAWQDGTLRTITEAMLQSVVQQCWTSGGNPTDVMVGGTIKAAISAFAGVATKTIQQTASKAAVIIGSADIYVSEFGVLSIIPNRFQRSRDVFLIDWEYVSVDYLRPFRQIPLAKTGAAEKRLLDVEFGLRVKNEQALGVIMSVQP